MLETADRDLTPIEMQFVDLARISTGKDAIIEKLREEIKQLHDSLKERERYEKFAIQHDKKEHHLYKLITFEFRSDTDLGRTFVGRRKYTGGRSQRVSDDRSP